MHGAGSLTKYWAHGEGELKLRGIEARQHSTCDWISSLQSRAFELLVEQKSSTCYCMISNSTTNYLHASRLAEKARAP